MWDFPIEVGDFLASHAWHRRLKLIAIIIAIESTSVHRNCFPYIWVNCNDLTSRPSPGIMVSKGNHPQVAQQFRLVNYYNLPIYIYIPNPQSALNPHRWIPMSRNLFLFTEAWNITQGLRSAADGKNFSFGLRAGVSCISSCRLAWFRKNHLSHLSHRNSGLTHWKWWFSIVNLDLEMSYLCEPLKKQWLIDCYRGFNPTWFTGDYDGPHRIGKPFSTN